MASAEQREIDLVDKVNLRIINVANQGPKLTALLKTYLAPLLLKAGSEHAAVRQKVVLIAHRLKTFIKSPDVVLPVATLLEQYMKNPHPIIRQLDITFIQHSIERIQPDERRAIVELLLGGIASDEGRAVGARFNLFLHVLKDIVVPPRGSKKDEVFRSELGLTEAEDAAFVAEKLGHIFLLVLGEEKSSPGLTEDEITFLTLGKPTETWNTTGIDSLDLPLTRIRAVKLLESGAFTDDERFLPAVYAASSTDYRINSVGEAMLMRSKASLEDEERVKTLYERHACLPPPYRIRILNLLSKSAASTDSKFTEEILSVPRPDGLQLAKIHRALFAYLNWLARIGPGRGDFDVGRMLVEMLKTFITVELGWPKPKQSMNTLDGQVLRARAFETIGLLAKSSPMKPKKQLYLVAWLLRSLSEDPTPDLVVNIEGALSSMASLFKFNDQNLLELRSILIAYMFLPDGGDAIRSTRHAVTKLVNRCLPLSDPLARWMNIVAIAGREDERTEVIEEGLKGLDPWWYQLNDDQRHQPIPDWQSLTHHFFKSRIDCGTPPSRIVQGVQQNFPNLADTAYPTAVAYCKKMLFATALNKTFKFGPDWERQLETLVQTDRQTRSEIEVYLGSVQGTSLTDLLEAAFEGIKEDARSTEECARAFVDVASLCTIGVLAPFAMKGLHNLLAVLQSNNKEVRALAARCIGILGAHPVVPMETLNVLHHILLERARGWKTAVGAEMNAVEGAFLALGHLWSRGRYYPHRSQDPPPPKRRRTDSGQDIAKQAAAAIQSMKESFLMGKDAPNDTLSIRPESAPASFQDVILTVKAQLWTASFVDEKKPIDTELDLLVPQCKKGNERAITALGRLTIGWSDGSAEVDTVLSKLYELHELKQAEVHFTIGEAITATVVRWDSDIVGLTADVKSTWGDYRVGMRPEKMKQALNKILADCKTTKPSLLKASGIWLFSIIRYCAHLPDIQSRLRECQVAFMRLLSARDELVQETASRGLALVYERGTQALKEDLVKDLVGAFTGSSTQLKVEEETELFEAGALPTGEGKSVTSYKDIVSLANEVGDQTLVYKFMSLASNAATWSTRSAFGKFGLSNILSGTEIDPKLYPKLYRYRFDPNPNVQRSMNDIWKALVKDSNAVAEKHFDAIITDLLKSIHGKEWRVRQASCAAITDLIGGRPFQKYEKYYGEIWTKALKVLDDVKATVRESAMRLCMSMANTLTRQLEEGGVSASARDMMASTLPFLLSDNGIESSVEEVKSFAITTVITITKTGGKALQPYIANIVSHMLGLLSTIEPDAVNYYYQRFGEDGRGKIDKLRSQMVGQSPIFQAIENCLRNADADVMPQLAAGLEETIKSAIGMPTKVGCGRVLGTLATRHTSDFQPYAARFLQIMEKQALDKNDEVSGGYARAAAYIMRHAPSEAKEHFVDKYVALFFAAEDEARREKVAAVILSLSKISPDHFSALEGSLLPFSYLGMHDTDEYVAKAFKEVWETHAGSARTATRFVPEIVALVTRSLDAPQWSLKHAGALTVGDAVRAVAAQGDLTGSTVNVGQLRQLWPALDKALALKTFEGKEKLLDALADVHTKAKAFWEGDGTVAAQLKKMVLREAKRNNEAYRVHAFKCLCQCAAARDDLEGGLWKDIVGIVKPFLEAYVDDEKNHTEANSSTGDAKEVAKARESELQAYKTVLNATEAVARGYSRPMMRKAPLDVLREILDVLAPFLDKRKFDSIRREVWYDCAGDLMGESAKTDPTTTATAGSDNKDSSGEKVALDYFATLDADKPDVGVESHRLARAKATLALGAKEQIKKTVETALEGERSMEVKKVVKEALAALNEGGDVRLVSLST
ncbi:hypothetical protein M406DRAFT_63530 [Cryphonectria parasitica EP155]|uniref:Proteasome component ECM29 n=1 Tax=Cryphonectria parasitica (strain ATCC 38755 / EP155) TaxID=660469 RepID=A0A9P4XXQ4_CRYP1|nr:uncharacterized protein M406DRAFT_63530 [Cryphonectria parasitica EP155]KAF3762700.1 hypothetical protein M406DRAFT_63530 [Cryphonectria parasitica EP155]